MNTYDEWAAAYPEAAIALAGVIAPELPTTGDGSSEARAQQAVRLRVAQAGAYAWRNNVGATPARCPDCGQPQSVIRYGLANESTQLNKRMKSSDLITATPILITPAMVGTTIAQFGAIEVKRPGWKYTGKGREAGQAAWITLINQIGGRAFFSTGDIIL